MPCSGPHARNPGRVLTLAMMNSALGTGLRTGLPDLEVHVSAGDLAAYSYDGTAALMARPSAVVFATNAEQVAGLLRFALRR